MIRMIWRAVDVVGHADEVLEAVRSLRDRTPTSLDDPIAPV
jgi:hypothetical protein